MSAFIAAQREAASPSESGQQPRSPVLVPFPGWGLEPSYPLSERPSLRPPLLHVLAHVLTSILLRSLSLERRHGKQRLHLTTHPVPLLAPSTPNLPLHALTPDVYKFCFVLLRGRGRGHAQTRSTAPLGPCGFAWIADPHSQPTTRAATAHNRLYVKRLFR